MQPVPHTAVASDAANVFAPVPWYDIKHDAEPALPIIMLATDTSTVPDGRHVNGH